MSSLSLSLELELLLVLLEVLDDELLLEEDELEEDELSTFSFSDLPKKLSRGCGFPLRLLLTRLFDMTGVLIITASDAGVVGFLQ